MRAQFVFQGLASEDLDQLHRVLDDKLVLDDTGTTASKWTGGIYGLAASAASIPVSFGSIASASRVYIKVANEIGVQFGSNTAPLFFIRPVLGVVVGGVVLSSSQQFDQPGYLFLTGKVSSIFLSNPSAITAATASVFLLGEAT